MTDEGHLDPEIAALLRREAGRNDGSRIPEGAQARVLGRLAAAIPALSGAEGGGQNGDGGAESGSGAGADAGASTGSAVTVGSSFIAKAAPVVLAFVVGAAAGAGAMRATTPRAAPSASPAIVERRAPDSADAPAAPLASRPATPIVVSVESLPTAAVPPARSSARPLPSGEDPFVVERRLLDTARTVLANGDPAGALRSLEQHERTFHNGHLVEEREALFVRALVEAGRAADARTRATQFRARFPRSLFLPAVEAAVTTEP